VFEYNGVNNVLVEMQPLVDLTRDSIESIGFYLGTTGGVYVARQETRMTSTTIRRVLAPPSLARELYDDMAAFRSGLGTISVGDTGSEMVGSVLGGMIGQLYQNRVLRNTIQANPDFVHMFSRTDMGLINNSASGIQAFNDDVMPLYRYRVGVFQPF